MPSSCIIEGCPGNVGWNKPVEQCFSLPSKISEKNKKFGGQNERNKRVVELSKRRREAWLKALKKDNFPDNKSFKVCRLHFISGKPADLEDEDNPDWVPCLNLGYKTSTIGRTQAALKRHVRHQTNERRNAAVQIYGGSSDAPVFIDADDMEEVVVASEEAGTSKRRRINDDDDEDEDSSEESYDTDKTNEPFKAQPVNPNEKYGHWHMHFCRKKACLYSKEVAKANSTLDTPRQDDEDNNDE